MNVWPLAIRLGELAWTAVLVPCLLWYAGYFVQCSVEEGYTRARLRAMFLGLDSMSALTAVLLLFHAVTPNPVWQMLVSPDPPAALPYGATIPYGKRTYSDLFFAFQLFEAGMAFSVIKLTAGRNINAVPLLQHKLIVALVVPCFVAWAIIFL